MVKTVVATGTLSGLVTWHLSHRSSVLLYRPEPYHFILGVGDTITTQTSYDCLDWDRNVYTVTVLPLDLSSLPSMQSLAENVRSRLGPHKLNYLILCASTLDSADGPGPNGSPWCAGLVVNHLAQHYLIYLLRDSLSASQSRVVVVSSGAIRNVRGQDPASSMGLLMDIPDTKSIPEGARNLLQAFAANDLLSDPEQIFLTSWGEWWPKDVIHCPWTRTSKESGAGREKRLKGLSGLPGV
ncbi:hypothetical protein BDV27DRAFT_167239 [Aspergillus caelatus]|uniref:NAD(P)-binding domain-containing protein n=1 Tax=Aspergillus caelatus TaxID=61420 RepID=A0A5N6ZUB0_9EURO|nr:uncharacterized protein BDV27DRAFT_167239 [Aspergillus caelatus]KAE8360995.1 hypothetical protein BDV27DRAFT_167239 [Aspergillus caelatus]